MHLRMQGLDPAVHHFRKAGQFRDVLDLQSGGGDRLGGAAGGDEFDAVAGQRAGEFDQSGFVGNGQQSAGDAARMVGHGQGPLLRGAFAQARGRYSRASRWCSIQSRQSRECALVSSFCATFTTARPRSMRCRSAFYSGNSGSRRALRRAVVAEADVVERTKLQRIDGGVLRILPDHDLGGAAGAVIAGQEHAVFQLDLVVERLEGPDVAVRQHQHHAAGVAEPARLHRRVQMKPQRIIGVACP